MERAARSQAEVVTSNILSMINGENPFAIYRPVDVEGVIKLTLGKVSRAVYYNIIFGHFNPSKTALNPLYQVLTDLSPDSTIGPCTSKKTVVAN